MKPSQPLGHLKNLMTFSSWNTDTWTALVTIAIGVTIWLLIPYHVDEPRALFGQIHSGMSPKLFPQFAATGFIIIGVLYLFASFAMQNANTFASLTLQDYAGLGLVLIIMTAYVTALQPLGFVISSGLTALAITLFYGSRSIIGIAIVAIVAPLLVYTMFTRLLSVSLPAFPWISS